MDNIRTISLDNWVQRGGGAYGKTYDNAQYPDMLLKVSHGADGTQKGVINEFNCSKRVYDLGISTPKVYGIVKVGSRYGILCQKLTDKKSFSRLIADNPERIPQIADVMAQRFKELTSRECDTTMFPNRKEQVLRAVWHYRYLTKKERDKLSCFISAIPDCTTCLHGDFQFGNIVRTPEKEYWIDLGQFGYGDPRFDIGHLLFAITQTKLAFARRIFHLTQSQAWQFWDCFVKSMLGESYNKETAAQFTADAYRFVIMDRLFDNIIRYRWYIELLYAPGLKRYIRKYL